MPSLTSDFTSDFSQNPILLNLFVNQYNSTEGILNIDEYIDIAWPTKLFPKDQVDKKTYGLPPYVDSLSSLEDQQKENDWFELVGIGFYSLSEEKRKFLLKTAGVIKFKKKIDIKKMYSTSIY